MSAYRTDVIYHWINEDYDDEVFFTSPDGIGRVFYNSTYEAVEESGITNIIHVYNLADI